MTNNVAFTYAQDTTAPIKEAKVQNSAGYLDLIVNKNKNGKAIRIATKNGMERVHVTLGEVDGLIAALKEVKARGVKTSVNELSYNNF